MLVETDEFETIDELVSFLRKRGCNKYSANIDTPKNTMIGWTCPVCGRGLSPYTLVCPCRGTLVYEVTC